MKVLKNLMLALGVLGLSVSGAKAAAEFDEVINSSWTVYVVSVASDPATQVDSASIVMENRKVVELQNLDTSANMYCLHRSSVTATGLGKRLPQVLVGLLL